MIDMWTIEVPERYSQQALHAMAITDISTQAVGSKNPTINLRNVAVVSHE